MGLVDPALRGPQTPKLKGAGQRPSAKTTGVWSSGATGCWRHWRTNWLRTCACGSVSALASASRVWACNCCTRACHRALLREGVVGVRGLDEDLRLTGLQGDALQLLDAPDALLPVLRQVADESKALSVQSAGRQRQQQRDRADQGQHADAKLVRGAHHR